MLELNKNGFPVPIFNMPLLPLTKILLSRHFIRPNPPTDSDVNSLGISTNIPIFSSVIPDSGHFRILLYADSIVIAPANFIY
jgi:hypothetical protein